MTSAAPRWRIGAVDVVAVLESATVFTPDFVRQVVPDATRANLARLPWLAPAWVDDAWDPKMVVQAFVVRSRGRVIVVDTCIGNDKVRRNPAFHRLQTGFLGALVAVVGALDAVDVVLCTHLHFDHVGWNTRWDGAAWVPTFPRARYLLGAAEVAHWQAQGERHRWLLDDSITPVVAAGLVDLVASDHTITDEVALVPTPGHTPGHVSLRIRSAGAEALITGDAIHHPCQVAHPEWASPADTDRARAVATRTALLADAAARGVVVIGTHFAHPAAGRVVAPGAATGAVPEPFDQRARFEPVPPEPAGPTL